MSQASIDILVSKAFKVGEIPSKEQQLEWARMWKKSGDRLAVDNLLRANIRALLQECHSFKNENSDSFDDIISVGLDAFMKSLQRFDPDHPSKMSFSTFMRTWVRAYIYQHLFNYSRLLKINTTTASRKIFFKKRKINEIMLTSDLEKKEEMLKNLCQELELSMEQVLQYLEASRTYEVSISSSMKEAVENSSVSEETIAGSTSLEKFEENIFREEVARELEYAFSFISKRDQDMIKAYFFNDSTYASLGKKHKISRERVRQIINSSLKKMKWALIDDIGAEDFR